MRRLLLAVFLGACEGQAVLQGEQGPVDGVIGVSGAPKVTVFSCVKSSIEATVPLSCSVGATHPRGSGLSCRLESSSGERIELGDCSNQRATEVKWMTPGAATLRLVVVDEEAQQTERTLQVEVLLAPNQLPRITTFSASRTTGVTPFTSTLTIDANDPDSSDVQCELAPGGPVPCARGRHAVDVTARGATPVTLSVRDGRGGVVTQTVTLTGVAPVGDVRVDSVQLGQSVVSPTLKLVEGKPALVVAHVLSDTPGLGSVVEVIGRRAGMELGRQRLTGPAMHATAPVDLSRQYRGTIPGAWVAPGLELTVVADAMDSLPESNEQNNELTSTPAIGRRNVLHLTSVPVVVSGTTSSVPDLKDTMVAQWPLVDVMSRTRAPYTTSQVPSGADVSSWGALLSEIAQVRGADGSSRHYYGFVRANSYGIAGIGYVGQPTAIGRDDNEGVASHELGHNFGRNHAPCGGAAGADPSYPYPNANLGSWGWNGQSLINPAQYVDLMSYCGPTWISDYTYVGAQRALERDQDYGPTPPQAMVLEPSVLVAAVIRGESIQLEPLHVLLAARTHVERSDWSVRLTTMDGAEHESAVRVAKVSDSDDDHLLGLVADVGPLRSVELLHHGTVVLRQLAQPVSLTSVRVSRVDGQHVRVEWNATAAPFLSVAHFGGERATLTLRARGGSVVVAHDGLEGGELELSASSGVASVRQRVAMP